MDDIIKLSLLDEVDTQAILAIKSYKKMEQLLQKPETLQHKEVWTYLQAFLAHSGILGTLFFTKGNPEKTKKVTEYLKQELEIKGDCSLQERGGRNFLEHIESFEIYVANRKDDKGILQHVFLNRNEFNYLPSDRYYYKRVLVLDEMVFAYHNQQKINELPLEPIINEVKRIFNASDKARNRLNIIQY